MNPLTERQRRQQLAIRAAVLGTVVSLWPNFDEEDIDDSWATIAPGIMAAIEVGRRISADSAANYYTAIRATEGVPDRFTPPLFLGDDWKRAAAVSLLVTGPITAKSLIARNAPNVAETTLVRVSGAVGRHVVNAGRETLLQSVKQDRRARGWARVGGGNSCDFCEMLIGRGAVYGEESGDFQAHDHCVCGLEPVFA